jgi:hypothetical protein
MSPALIFTTNGEIMALQSKKNEKPIEEQVSLDLGLEVERVDIDAEAETGGQVYYTITGKEQQYNPEWEIYNINDLDVGDELEGEPEVTIFEKEDKSYNAARLRLIDEEEIVNLYFNFPKKAYPVVRNLKNIRTGEKDEFDFYLNCYDVCFSVLKCLDEKNIKDSNGDTINKIKAINLETVLKIIDTSKKVKVRIIEGSPYNDYLSWGIISME